jgi:hypothetical protein
VPWSAAWLFGSAEAVHERYARRYIPAQRRYLAECQPHENADLIIENVDPAAQVLIVQQDDRMARVVAAAWSPRASSCHSCG